MRAADHSLSSLFSLLASPFHNLRQPANSPRRHQTPASAASPSSPSKHQILWATGRNGSHPPLPRLRQILGSPPHRQLRHRRLPRCPILRLRHRLHLLRRQRQQIPHLQNFRRRQNLEHAIFRPAPRLLPRRPRLPLRKRLPRHQRSHRQQIPHPPHRRRRALDRTPASLRALRPPHRRRLRRQQLLPHPLRPQPEPTSSSPPAAPPPASSTPPTTPALGPSRQRPSSAATLPPASSPSHALVAP